MFIISTPNGVKGSKALNEASDKLRKKFSKSPNLKFYFEMGFDGKFEFMIENKKTNRKICMRENDANEFQVYCYFRNVDQAFEDVTFRIRKSQIIETAEKSITVMARPTF
jgi:hypothetical protein